MHRQKGWVALFFCLIPFHGNLSAQTLSSLSTGQNVSFRGLYVVNDRILWVSGSGGTIGRSTDSGVSWEWFHPAGFETRDFRDIEAFNDKEALVLAVGEPGIVLKTTDAGKSWQVVYSDSVKGVFFDDMYFANPSEGVLIGDPLPGTSQVYRIFTRNGGNSWYHPGEDECALPPVQTGEAMFAASGSNLVVFHDSKNSNLQLLVVTGGSRSRLLASSGAQSFLLPMIQGKETTGANSISAFNRKILAVAGGDFANDKDSVQNFCYSSDGGKTWKKALKAPQGYKSCVLYFNRHILVACGTSGVDISHNGGKTWKRVSSTGYHVCKKASNGISVFLAGANGRMAVLRP